MSTNNCGHDCKGHDSKHVHGPKCGHDTVKHDGHVDYIVFHTSAGSAGDGHRHHVHGTHCDDHGKI